MDYVPTTMLDAICQYHNLMYGHRPNSLKRDDDREFNLMIHNWSRANAGDGWSGPTYYEKQSVIPFIKRVFSLKGAVGSESPWTKAVIPSVLRQYLTEFKHALVNADGTHFSQFQRSKQDPLNSLDNMYDHAFEESNVKRDRTRNKKYQALNEALDDMEEIKTYWDRQSISRC